MFYSFSIFLDAVNNEISIEKDLLKRLARNDLTFTPLRALKTLKYIDKYHISNTIYTLLGLIFVVVSSVYFFVKMLKAIFSRKNYLSSENIDKRNLVLVANGRVEYLFKKLNLEKNIKFLNINQAHKQKVCHAYRFLGLKDYLLAYVYAISSVPYLLFNLNDKKDILQSYVAYEWFLVYIALLKIRDEVRNVYFANHYDRWAVMFDQLFADKKVVLLQHGILPEDLELSYKLKNINQIYSFDEKSTDVFKKLFNCQNTNFQLLDISLKLTNVYSRKKTILIIGQPHSMKQEIAIAKRLQTLDAFEIYIKPHPLYDSNGYKQIKDVILIQDRNFYPKIDLALCYESTLGLEYEASGVPVIWWKDMNNENIEKLCKNFNK